MCSIPFDRRGHALLVLYDAGRELVGQQTAIGPHHGDRRNLDIGKDVCRRLEGGHDAEQNDQDRQNDKGTAAAAPSRRLHSYVSFSPVQGF
jgi:hypothetical protein